MRLRCNACLGEYDDVLPDGTEYYHACPPLPDAAIVAALALPADPAAWTAAERRAFERADRRRPNMRNENIDRAKDQATRDARGDRIAGTAREALLVAAGAGVTPLEGGR